MVTGWGGASLLDHPQSAGFDEANELEPFRNQQSVGPFRIGAGGTTRSPPLPRKLRLHMGLFLDSINLASIVAGFAWNWIATVTRCTAQTHRVSAVLQFFQCFGGTVLMHRLN